MGKAKKILAGVLIAAIVTGGTYAGLQAVKKQNINLQIFTIFIII